MIAKPSFSKFVNKIKQGTVTPELIAVIGILITTKNLTNALAHHSKYQRHLVEKERDV